MLGVTVAITGRGRVLRGTTQTFSVDLAGLVVELVQGLDKLHLNAGFDDFPFLFFIFLLVNSVLALLQSLLDLIELLKEAVNV